MVQCLTAAIAHPDVAGARHYADHLVLNPRLRGWFGVDGADPAPVRLSATVGTPGARVTLRAPATAGAGTVRYRIDQVH